MIHLVPLWLPNPSRIISFRKLTCQLDYLFLKNLIKGGVNQILVTGTCFKYGEQSGALTESMPVSPANAYGIAKHVASILDRTWERAPFALQWARLFYMHGTGQSERSLLAQLNAAIDRGDTVFPMSGGEQLRDYLPVERALNGLSTCWNAGSRAVLPTSAVRSPVSVRKLVEDHIRSRGSQKNRAHHVIPYAKHEPFAFWGDSRLLDGLIEKGTTMATKELFRASGLPTPKTKPMRRFWKRKLAKLVIWFWQDCQSGLVKNIVTIPALSAMMNHIKMNKVIHWHFKRHISDVTSIIKRHFSNRRIVEVGCGKAFFLEHLLEQGFDIVVDPAYVHKHASDQSQLRCILGPSGDAILRHVLEHIQNPVDFLDAISQANGGIGLIYIEVPCFDWIMKQCAWFDIF